MGTEEKYDNTFKSANVKRQYLFNNHISYLDLEIDDLIPLWIGIFFNDFCAQLKENKNQFNTNKIQKVEALRKHFISKVNMKTFFPAKLTSKYGSTKFFRSPSPPKTCFTVWMKASSTTRNSWGEFLRELQPPWTPVVSGINVGLTLWHILGSVDFEAECRPSHCDSSWHQQITFNVILLVTYLSLLNLVPEEDRQGEESKVWHDFFTHKHPNLSS